MRFGRLMSNVLGLAILLPSVLVAQEPPRGSSDRTNWFNSLDKNGDGRLSHEEVPGPISARIKRQTT